MERLKAIKNQLIAQVQTQMSDLKCVDTHELGEVIDMIKDITQAMYYCEVYKAMEESQEEGKETNNYYYTEKYLPAMTNMSRDMSNFFTNLRFMEKRWLGHSLKAPRLNYSKAFCEVVEALFRFLKMWYPDNISQTGLK